MRKAGSEPIGVRIEMEAAVELLEDRMKNQAETTSIKCPQCGAVNVFNQPYPFHAGIGNQGFLYNEAGDRTLVWDNLKDVDYLAAVGPYQPWILNKAQQQKLESILEPDAGGRWLFKNPARCHHCHSSISGPMINSFYYVVYDRSTHGIWSVMKVPVPNNKTP